MYFKLEKNFVLLKPVKSVSTNTSPCMYTFGNVYWDSVQLLIQFSNGFCTIHTGCPWNSITKKHRLDLNELIPCFLNTSISPFLGDFVKKKQASSAEKLKFTYLSLWENIEMLPKAASTYLGAIKRADLTFILPIKTAWLTVLQQPTTWVLKKIEKVTWISGYLCN